MSADVTALKRGKRGNSSPLHSFETKNRRETIRRVKFTTKVQEKASIPAGISRQEINTFT